jgi:hypothetical protein
MTRNNRSNRISPALVISCVALFLALTGSALAVGIAKNSVRSAQIVDGSVRTVDLRDSAITTPKIADSAVGTPKIAEAAVDSSKVADGSLTVADLGDNSVGAPEILPDSVGASELGTVSVRTNATTLAKGASGSITANCAAGEQLLSGGGQPGHFGTEMTSSRPQANGWLYQATNNTGGQETITAFAVCLG